MTIYSHNPYQGISMSQILLEMAKDLVLAQIRAQRLSPEAMP